mgnify:CR=1 FL=1
MGAGIRRWEWLAAGWRVGRYQMARCPKLPGVSLNEVPATPQLRPLCSPTTLNGRGTALTLSAGGRTSAAYAS